MHRLTLLLMASLIVTKAPAQERETIILSQNTYDLSTSGRTFLLNESRHADFFMLGELHGEKEIPNLLTSIWPDLNRAGYRHIAAEVSEWAADKLESPKGNDSLKVEGVWTNREARLIQAATNKPSRKILWACDMEEISLGDMMKEFVAKNSSDERSAEALAAIRDGYNRKLAPQLLTVFDNGDPNRKYSDNDLYQAIIISLKIDSARAFPESRFRAQTLREELMKRSFMKNYNSNPSSKILLRFGRNHLHYGFDERGISTLGNFVAELSVAKGLKCFNVATFAAGGQCRLMGNTFDADERADDLAFQFLSEKAPYNETLFDLRPLRNYLHTVASDKRSDLQRRLLYWADSYDAILCFRSVTPR